MLNDVVHLVHRTGEFGVDLPLRVTPAVGLDKRRIVGMKNSNYVPRTARLVEISHNDRLGNVRIAAKIGFKLLGEDVFSAGSDNNILFSARDVKEPVGIDIPEIAGVEPTIANDLGGKFGRTVVAKHNIVALVADLARAVVLHIVDVKHPVGSGKTGGIVAVVVILVDRGKRRAFGKTVSLYGKQAEIAQTAHDLGIGGGSAADEHSYPAAERIVYLGKNTPLQPKPRMTGQLYGVPDLFFDTLAADVHPYLAVNGLKQNGNTAYNGRTHLLHVARNVAESLGKCHTAAAREREKEAAGAFVYMVHRQDGKEDLLRSDVRHVRDLA